VIIQIVNTVSSIKMKNSVRKKKEILYHSKNKSTIF